MSKNSNSSVVVRIGGESNSSPASSSVKVKKTVTPRGFNDLLKDTKNRQKEDKQLEIQEDTSLRINSEDTSLQHLEQSPVFYQDVNIVDVPFDLIRIPSWFSKRYVSRAEVNRCLDAIKAGGIGLPDILLRYCSNENGEKYYELIDGIVSLTAFKELNLISHRCKVVDNPKFSTTDAILVALALNTRENLSPWESTIMGLDFLVKVFGFKTEVEYSYSKFTGTSSKREIGAREQAVGHCNKTLQFRKARVKLSSEEKIKNEEFQRLQQEITPEVERTIDLMLSSIGIDLTTFVEKRSKLLKLPKRVKEALELGTLHYTKAITISHIGTTFELKGIVDRLGDREVIEEIDIEIDKLVKETVANNLSNKEVLNRVHQANCRLLALGTDDSYAGLSDEQIGDRQRFREDMKLQSNLKHDLYTVVRFVKKPDFMERLDEREKSNLQKKVAQLGKMIQGLNEKHFEENLSLNLI